MTLGFHHILDRDKTLQSEVVIHHQHFFDPVFVKFCLNFQMASTLSHRDQTILRRHHIANQHIEIRNETNIATGDDTDQIIAFNDRDTADVVMTCDGE